MKKFLLNVAIRFWPELAHVSELERLSGVGDVLGFLYLAPLAVVGVVWLAAVTDLTLILTDWPTLLFFLILIYLFRKLGFFVVLEGRPGIYADFDGSLETTAIWWAALLYGPSVLWFGVLWAGASFVRHWPELTAARTRWNRFRNTASQITAQTLPGLVALSLYTRWDGVFPMPGLALNDVLLALGATAIQFILSGLFLLPLIFYWGSSRLLAGDVASSRRTVMQFVMALVTIPRGADFFAVLAAGLYSQVGQGAALFFTSNLLLGSFLSHQLSKAVEYNRQRSRELERLEQLGRAIINSPADASDLPMLVRDHLPGMFPPGSRVEIRLYSDDTQLDQTLAHHPRQWPVVDEQVWEWIKTIPEVGYFLPKETLPWNGQPAEHGLIVAPIVRAEGIEPVGGIYLQRITLERQDTGSIRGLLPAVQTLAAQIGSALHGAEVYKQTIAHEKISQELTLAGEIQESFLPDAVPEIEGWQLAATLEPARETSGDFFDVFPLPNGRLGLIVADVADKGMGAALYMSLSRTLIRTYADQYVSQPDRALDAANRRILKDTRSDLFVTVFYGILDPETGKLTYCNAGHNPPYLLSEGDAGEVSALTRTGLPLGAVEEWNWTQGSVQIGPGDTLVAYSDGITEAQNRQRMFFGEERLLDVMRANAGRSAREVQSALLSEVRDFVDDQPQYDDITLLVVVRDK